MSAAEPKQEKKRGVGPGVTPRVTTVRVQLEQDIIRDDDGNAAEFSVAFYVRDTETLKGYKRILDTAGAGLTGKVREEAKERAFFDVFERLVKEVDGYAGTEGMTPRELREFFEGHRMPEGIEKEDADFWTEQLGKHAIQAINGYFGSLSVTPSFRA